MSTTMADSILELAKANQETYRLAYEAGRAAGYQSGFQEGAKWASDRMKVVLDRVKEQNQ